MKSASLRAKGHAPSPNPRHRGRSPIAPKSEIQKCSSNLVAVTEKIPDHHAIPVEPLVFIIIPVQAEPSKPECGSRCMYHLAECPTLSQIMQPLVMFLSLRKWALLLLEIGILDGLQSGFACLRLMLERVRSIRRVAMFAGWPCLPGGYIYSLIRVHVHVHVRFRLSEARGTDRVLACALLRHGL